MRNQTLITAVVSIAALTGWYWVATAPAASTRNETSLAQPASPSKLAIVWTSGDPDVAHRMTLMYTGAANKNKWFDQVRLVIWGPSQRLAVADKDVRAAIERIAAAGVKVEACLACADTYGIADDLRAIPGVEVKYMGQPLTEFLKSDDWAVISF